MIVEAVVLDAELGDFVWLERARDAGAGKEPE